MTTQTKRITYYAFARNPQNRVEQMIVVREGVPGHMRQVSQEWTGVTYRNERAAWAAMESLNVGVVSESI